MARIGHLSHYIEINGYHNTVRDGVFSMIQAQRREYIKTANEFQPCNDKTI